ncbi:MAG: tungstate ABC transporter substrate-binding protein WtpA [Planctomycetota bacterium]
MSRTTAAVLAVAALGILALAGLSIHSSQTTARSDPDSNQLIIFHAGSLAVPFRQICEEFNRQHPNVKIVRETAGSRECAHKIIDLHKPCDIMASADYVVIDTLLIPEYAMWNIKFASNEMGIAFSKNSYRAGQITDENWYDILLEEDAAYGRSDPNADPCGYRTMLMAKLAEEYYDKPGLADRILAKDRKYIRPKEVDLLALLEVGELDYVFIYRSVARQHELEFLELPDEINLNNVEFSDFYRTASVHLTGKTKGTLITQVGTPIVYGVTIPSNAPNRKLALTFLSFLLDADKGQAILEKNGQTSVVPSPADTFDKLPESLKIFALPMKPEGQK